MKHEPDCVVLASKRKPKYWPGPFSCAEQADGTIEVRDWREVEPGTKGPLVAVVFGDMVAARGMCDVYPVLDALHDAVNALCEAGMDTDRFDDILERTRYLYEARLREYERLGHPKGGA